MPMQIVSVPLRPEILLNETILYGLFAFLLGLAFTPWFISFLKKNSTGKQIRVETVDGKQASVFRQYHKDKHGTPTMGGVLIWSAILATVLFSRFLSYIGKVDHSLLQRGQVYLPLFILVSLVSLELLMII